MEENSQLTNISVELNDLNSYQKTKLLQPAILIPISSGEAFPLLPFQSPGAYSVEPANSASNPSTMQSSLLMSMRNASFSVVDTNIHGNVIQVFSKHFLLRSPSIPMPSNPRAASVIPLASALTSCSVKTHSDDQLYLTLTKDRDGGHWLYVMLIEDRGGSTFRFTPFLPKREAMTIGFSSCLAKTVAAAVKGASGWQCTGAPAVMEKVDGTLTITREQTMAMAALSYMMAVPSSQRRFLRLSSCMCLTCADGHSSGLWATVSSRSGHRSPDPQRGTALGLFCLLRPAR